MIEWRDELAIDHGGLDADHQEQHALIRRFIGTPSHDGARPTPISLLKALRAVSVRHFIREERVQAVVNYPAIIEHQAQHRRLLELLDDIAEQLDQTTSLFDYAYRKAHADGLLEFWFFDHFAKADLGLRRHLALHPLPRAPQSMHSPQGSPSNRTS